MAQKFQTCVVAQLSCFTVIMSNIIGKEPERYGGENNHASNNSARRYQEPSELKHQKDPILVAICCNWVFIA